MTSESRRYKRLSDAEWSVILQEYASGTATLQQIADRYDISPATISVRARKAGVSRHLRIASGHLRIAATSATGSTFRAASEVTDVPLTAEEIISRIRATKATALSDTQKLQDTIRACVSALPVPRDASEILPVARAAEMLTGSLSKLYKIQSLVLGLADENKDADAILPVLPIRDMTTEEEQAIRRRQEQEDAGLLFDETGNIIDNEEDMEVSEDDRIMEGFD